MDKYYYGYDEFVTDVQTLTKKVDEYKPDTLLAVARGGMTLGHFMAQAMGIRELYSLNSIHYNDSTKLDTIEIFNIPNMSQSKKVLIVDDIIDSGDTLKELVRILEQKYPSVQFKIATIFYKPTASIKADYTLKHAHDWIDFFWETDSQASSSV